MLERVKTWLKLTADQRGVTALEYAIIASVLAATLLIGFGVLANDLSNQFSNVGGAI